MSDKITSFNARHIVSRKSEFPKEHHLAIIIFDSIHIEGDERSRTNPGHGYPAHDVSCIRYHWWKLEHREYWEADILSMMTVVKKDFVALNNGVIYEPKLGLV